MCHPPRRDSFGATILFNPLCNKGFWPTFATGKEKRMKKIHIVLLILIAGAIGVLLSFMKTTSTFDSIESAKSKPGKFVHMMARLDKTQPIQYDPVKNPNYLSFTAVDTSGQTVKVVYHDAKPDNLEMSSSIAMKGKYVDGVFECSSIQPKCPSKYKEQQEKGEKHPDSVKIK